MGPYQPRMVRGFHKREQEPVSRIRSIHPGFFTDEALVSVSMSARLLFIGLGVEADDKGVFEWKPLTIKMRVFPADSIDVNALLAELEDVDAIRSYEMNGRKYAAIRNFRRFQKPKTPNDIHPMPDDFRNYVCLTGAISETQEVKRGAFPQNGETFPQMLENAFQMEEGGGRVEETISDEIVVQKSEKASAKIDEAVADWNAMASECGLPTVTKLSQSRKAALRSRLAEHGVDGWRACLAKIRASPFCLGQGGRDWRANFDFATRQGNFLKLIEGAYDGKRKDPAEGKYEGFTASGVAYLP